MAPVVKALLGRDVSTTLVHTGQHFDCDMGLRFFDELGLPKPDYSFRLGERQPAAQIAEILLELEKAINECQPDLILIQGDTNSMLAAALAGVKARRPVGHIEAGLRSYDWRMPEEHNRRMVDHVSDHLFAPTKISKANLLAEKVWGRIHVVGNTVIDAVDQYFPVAEKQSTILSSIPFSEYILATFHRQENVDNPYVLKSFVAAMTGSPTPIIFPIHPRTELRLRNTSLWTRLSKAKNVRILPPLGYFDLLVLMKHCRFIASDSGGLQEEATSPRIRKYVLVLRNSTERPEAVRAGFAMVVGTEYLSLRSALTRTWAAIPRLPNRSPFGDGSAGSRISRIVANSLRRQYLKSCHRRSKERHPDCQATESLTIHKASRATCASQQG